MGFCLLLKIWEKILTNIEVKTWLVTIARNLDNAKQSVTDAFKTTSKRGIQKTAEATGDFIGN